MTGDTDVSRQATLMYLGPRSLVLITHEGRVHHKSAASTRGKPQLSARLASGNQSLTPSVLGQETAQCRSVQSRQPTRTAMPLR